MYKILPIGWGLIKNINPRGWVLSRNSVIFASYTTQYIMTLSIIIPVYAVEETLKPCVESILQQSFHDLEVLLIDNGSPDKCPALCDDLAANDPRVKVIHQANRGLSAARNAGLDIAKGTYITFIDSDDFIGKDTYKDLMEELNRHPEYDLIEYPVVCFYGHKTKQSLLAFESMAYRDLARYWFETKAYRHAYAWNKIYRRELFNQLRFPTNTAFEDIHILPAVLKQCKIVATSNKGTYYYRYNPKGITSTATGEELTDLLNAHVQILSMPGIQQHDGFIDYYAHVLNIQLDVYEDTKQLPIIPEFSFSKNSKLPVKIKLLTIIGIKSLCQFNKYIHKIYRRSR